MHLAAGDVRVEAEGALDLIEEEAGSVRIHCLHHRALRQSGRLCQWERFVNRSGSSMGVVSSIGVVRHGERFVNGSGFV